MRPTWLVLLAAMAAVSCGSTTNAPATPDASTDASPTACGAPPADLDAVNARMNAKRGTMGSAPNAMVATSHALATKIGIDTLARGGNAVDAYIAATLAEDLVLPGVTSTAGLTGFLVYVAATQSFYYVQGPLKTMATAGGTGAGGQVMVPGEVAALALASKSYGKLAFSDVVAPVAALARQGFAIDHLYAASIAANQATLAQSAYGQKTFFANGAPLAEGATLAQPDVGDTLDAIGAGTFYTGGWASAFVAAVNAAGGRATLADLSGYQPLLEAPFIARYRGAYLYTSAGYSSGGARLLLALKTLENADLATLGPFDRSPASLELLLRVHDAERSQETWLDDPSILTHPELAAPKIDAGAAAMWAAVQAATPATGAPLEKGTHSSAVVVFDQAGNIVVGTHTIESTNWGLGLFVGGLPLATAAAEHPGLAPGAYAVDPLSSVIAFVAGKPRLALSTYGTGLHPGDVQVLANVLDFGMNAEDAVLEPRVGPHDYTLVTKDGMTQFTEDPTTHLLDERVPQDVVCAARAAGFGLAQRSPPGYSPGIIDTGFPTLVVSDQSGLHGMTPEWMSGVASGN